MVLAFLVSIPLFILIMQKRIINFRTLGYLCAVLVAMSVLPMQQAQAQIANQTQVETAKQVQLAELIHKLQETIITLQRKMTTLHGQREGENLINENSIAQTNVVIDLYTKPSYESDVVASQPVGVWGEVSAGPKLVAGEVWWQFDFRDETSGWSPESKLTRSPSTVIEIDVDLDGTPDSTFRLMGEFDSDGFTVEPVAGGTEIRYKGAKVEVYEIIER